MSRSEHMINAMAKYDVRLTMEPRLFLASLHFLIKQYNMAQ